MKDYHIASGRDTILPPSVEEELVSYCEWMFTRGFPMDQKQLQLVAYHTAAAHGVEDFQASPGWVSRFRQRNSDKLSLRCPQGLERVRVGSANPDLVMDYFNKLKALIEDATELNGGSFGPQDIFNQDEIGADQFSEKDAKVIAIRCSRRGARIQKSSDRTHVTASVFINGAGEMIDVFFVLKGLTQSEKPLEGCPAGTGYCHTENAFMTHDAYEKCVKHFIAQKQKKFGDRWIILLCDGFISHTMYPPVLRLFLEAHIKVLCIPSHLSFLLQVLDVACFRSAKNCLRYDLKELGRRLGPDGIEAKDYPMIFKAALRVGCSRQNIINGFKRVGAVPLNMNWVEEHK
ncbi:unnamed protein product, partial [Heterosigma akashiwo]